MSLIGDIIDRVLHPNREIHGIPVLDGAFSPNQRLDDAPRLGEAIDAPDDAVQGPDGALYVSSRDCILRCAGPSFGDRSVFCRLPAAVGGLTWTADGRLLACVSGAGLFALTAAGDVVAQLTSVGGQPIACPLSVVEAADGSIHLTDGSRDHPPQAWLTDLMRCRPPSGRLIEVAPDLSGARVRADGLAWPWGLALSPRGDELWVAESWAHRLSAYPLAGGTPRVIVKNYAGYPARLKRDPQGTCWMAFFALRTQLTEFVLRERDFCEEMMSSVPVELWIGPSMDGRFNYREPTQIGRIKKLGIQKPWAPARSYGLVARLGDDGEAVASLHSRVDGRVHGVTSVCVARLPAGAGVVSGMAGMAGDVGLLAVSKGRDGLYLLSEDR